MTANPWSKFFWNDWENDPALKLCSLAAQGLWMRCLCICAKADPKGYLLAAGRPLGATDLARLTGAPETEVETLLSELSRNGVFSRDRTGRIYSRRLVRDEKKARTARENGKNGGNPTLCKDKGNPSSDNPRLKPEVKPHKPRARSNSSDPKGSGSPAADLERELYRRAKEICGPSAGGIVTPLIRAKGGSIARARAAVEEASERADPSGFLWRIIRGPSQEAPADNGFVRVAI